jgi:hypothetical protein
MPGHKTKTERETQLELPILCITDTTNGEGRMIVKTNESLSLMNGRLYRQCMDYDLSFSVVNFPSNNTFQYQFYTLPNTWFVKGAIRYAFKTYMQSHAEELAAGVRFARWHDFNINEQNPDAVYEFSKPALFDGDGFASIAADESLSDSTVTDSAGTSRGFHLIGNLNNSYNIFRQYANLLKYGMTADDSVSSDQPYGELLDLDDADDMAEKGDQAPYDRDWSTWLPDDTTVDDAQGQNILVLRDTIQYDGQGGGAGRTKTRSFTAPLGLVWCIKVVDGSLSAFGTSEPEIMLHASPGKYKGVRAHSLVE